MTIEGRKALLGKRSRKIAYPHRRRGEERREERRGGKRTGEEKGGEEKRGEWS